MKTVRDIFISALCVACMSGCGSSGNKSDIDRGDQIVIGYGTYQTKQLGMNDYFSGMRIVPLETTEKSVLSDIQRVEVYDSLVFVCDDNNSLFVFNNNGRFISQIGRKGRGPGEYIGLKSFFVDSENKTVTMIDNMKNQLLTYGFDGVHRSSREFPPKAFNWGYYAMTVGKDNVFIFNTHNPDPNMAYTLMNLKNLEEPEYFCTYNPVRIETYTYHFANHPMTRSGEKIHFTMPLENTIYEYDAGKVAAKYYVETPLEVIPKQVMQEMEGSYFSKLSKLIVDNKYFGTFTDIFETDDFIFMHYMAKNAYPGLYIMDKSEKTGDFFRFPMETDILKTPVFPFLASNGNTLVSVVPVGKLFKLREFDAEGDYEMPADMKELLQEIRAEDNPVLIFYDLKH